MIHSLIQPKTVIAPMVLLMAIVLVSCGSYQQASYYDTDGIYTEGTERVTVNRSQQPRPPARVKDDDGIYGDYFGKKAQDIDEIMEDEVFTDVDSYYSDTDQEGDENVEQDTYFNGNNDYDGYAGWGDNATSVNINIYDGMGYGFYDYGWAHPWLYSGYNGFGWGNPWRFNFYSPWWGGYNGWGYAGNFGYGWGGNFGYGWGGNFGYGWGGNFGFGWGGYYNAFYCPPYYYSNGIYGNSYAYNQSRRGYYDRNALASNSYRGRSNLGTRSAGDANRYRTNSGRSNVNRDGVSSRSSVSSRNGITSRNSGNYRSGTTSRNIVSADAIARNRAYRTSRSTRSEPSYNSSSRSYQSYRGSEPRSSTYSRGNLPAVRSGNGAYRTTTPRSSGNYRSSGSSSTPRTSGYRSSGSSPRSSGTYRSSGASSSRSSGGSYRSSGSSSPRSSSGSVRSSSGSSRSSGGSVRSSGGSSRSSGGRSGRSN